jgi:hypothetical protein
VGTLIQVCSSVEMVTRRVLCIEVYSLSRNGQLFVFQCDTELSDLVEVDGVKPSKADVEPSSSEEEPEEPTEKKKKKKKGLIHCRGC